MLGQDLVPRSRTFAVAQSVGDIHLMEASGTLTDEAPSQVRLDPAREVVFARAGVVGTWI